MRMPFAWAFIAAVLLLCGRLAHAAPCAPAEVTGGSGSPIHVGSKNGGVYAFTFCKDEYTVRPVYLYATWDSLTPSVISEIQEARASVDSFAAAFGRVTGRQCEIEKDAEGVQAMVETEAWATHAELCFALRDAMAAVWPAEPVWEVVPSLTADKSRPMYPVVDGIRSSSAVRTPRAAANAPCSCTKATALPSGKSTRYCPVAPHPSNLVTYCRLVQ